MEGVILSMRPRLIEEGHFSPVAAKGMWRRGIGSEKDNARADGGRCLALRQPSAVSLGAGGAQSCLTSRITLRLTITLS